MATVNGARAMHLTKTDILAKGKLADIIMVDLNQPNMQPIHNIPKNIVYSGSKKNRKIKNINGKIVYDNGSFNVGEEPHKIYKECEKIVERLIYNKN